MKTLKKLLSCLIVLMLLPVSASAEGWLNGLFGGAKTPELRYVSVPEKAFGEENSRVLAATADESSVLINSYRELYLWNKSLGRRVPIVFTEETDLELFNFRIDTAAYMAFMKRPGNNSTREEVQQKVEEQKKEYLASNSLACLTSLDDINKCYGEIASLSARAEAIGPRWVIISLYQLNIVILLDMQTGQSRILEDGICTLCGDRLLTSKGITKLETGETYMPGVMDAEAQMPSWISDVRLLGDDSVLVLYPDPTMNEDKTRNIRLIDASAERTYFIDIGAFNATNIDFRLLCTRDGKYAAAYCPNAYMISESVIVDRVTGETKKTDIGDLMLIGQAQDAFLCYNVKTGQIALLKPDTLEQTSVKLKGMGLGAVLNYSQANSLVDNGENLYFAQQDNLHGYFKLTDG